VKGYEEVSLFLSKWSSVPFECVSSGDFSTMYTTIPHDDLKRVCERVLLEAWNWAVDKEKVDGGPNRLYVDWKPGKVEWYSKSRRNGDQSFHTARHHRLSVTSILTLIKWQLDNVLIQNGSVIYRQRKGVPIGTNNGPGYANIYLYGYESEYMDKLIQNDLEKARQFHMSFRLLDDTLSFNNSAWEEAIENVYEQGGMYPQALIYNSTNPSSKETTFLGMDLKIDDSSHIHIDVYDKRSVFKFQVQRYPEMKSFIPQSIPYGVFLGLLYRCYRICLRPNVFISNAISLCKIFHAKGCLGTRLLRLVSNFLDKQKPLRWKTKGRHMYDVIKRETEGAFRKPGA